MKKLNLRTGASIGLALLVPALAVAALELPHSFKAGDTIKSSEVNANFKALEDAVNAKRGVPQDLEMNLVYGDGDGERILQFRGAGELIVRPGNSRWPSASYRGWIGNGALGADVTCGGEECPQVILAVGGTTTLEVKDGDFVKFNFLGATNSASTLFFYWRPDGDAMGPVMVR